MKRSGHVRPPPHRAPEHGTPRRNCARQSCPQDPAPSHLFLRELPNGDAPTAPRSPAARAGGAGTRQCVYAIDAPRAYSLHLLSGKLLVSGDRRNTLVLIGTAATRTRRCARSYVHQSRGDKKGVTLRA